jgi:hypothetical protein
MVAVRVCACGCGTPVKTKWVRGHHSRVNNISKRIDVKEKRRKRMLRTHAEGKIQPWNRGLTKTDPRVAEQSLSLDAWRHSDKNASKMSEQWKTGNIVPAHDHKHSQWKGGTSHISRRMRASRALFAKWKRPILVRDGFECVKCESTRKLIVHHNDERFAAILKKCLIQRFPDADKRKITFEESTLVIDDVVNYHVSEKVSGITLCEECHKKEHSTS